MNKNDIILSLQRFKAEKGRDYRIRRIGLFGSVARDNFGLESDIDVVVELENQDLFALIGIKQDLEEELQGHVDIISYRDEMNGFLRTKIDKEAVYV